MIFYLDTSALVKRYVVEVGSQWVIALCSLSTEHTISAALITKAEAAAALAAKLRQRGLSQQSYDRALLDLEHDFTQEYLLVSIDSPLIDLAVMLTRRRKLRGYDAVQLAAALTLQDALSQVRLPSPVFVTADDNLLEAARQEGLRTANPNRA